MPSKKERRYILARIWSTPTPCELDFFDEGNQVVISSNNADIAGWWLKVFKTCYPEIRFTERVDTLKTKIAPNVTIKLNKTTSLLRIQGKNHWPWIVENLADILEQANAEVQSIGEVSEQNSVTRYLQLEKDVEEVQNLLDMIPEGGGIMTHDFIMRVWKAMIDDWCGCGSNIYIVTPRIDAERLFSIFLLMIRNKGTGFQVVLVTPQKSSNGDKFSKTLDVAKRMMKKTKTRQQTRLVSAVKMQYALDNLTIRHEEFSTNFIAACKDEEAEVLTTTAHFHKSHFHSNQKDNVCYIRLATAELKKNYLMPLNLSANY